MEGFIFICILVAIWWVWTLKKTYDRELSVLNKEINESHEEIKFLRELKSRVNYQRIDFVLDEFVSVDVETTGLKHVTSNIIQIAIVKFKNGVPVGKYVKYINPGVPIPDSATKVNKITDAMIAKESSFSSYSDVIYKMLTRYKVVGHNLRFDAKMIEYEFTRINKPLKINWGFCTMSQEVIRPDLESKPTRYKKLSDLAFEYKLTPDENFHDAYVDAMVTGKIAVLIAKENPVIVPFQERDKLIKIDAKIISLQNLIKYKNSRRNEIANSWIHKL